METERTLFIKEIIKVAQCSHRKTNYKNLKYQKGIKQKTIK